jgi:hypothetical protein
LKRNLILLPLSLLFLTVGSWGQGLEVLGSCPISGQGSGWAINVRGNYVYIGENSQIDFSVIDVSDPYNPSKIASLDLSPFGVVQDISVSGVYAYLAIWRSIAVVNISEPDSPFVVSIYQPFYEQGHRLFVRKGLLYLANCLDHFPIIDISNPAAPQIIGVFDSLCGGDAMGVFLDDSYAYFAEYNGGLYIVDVTNPQTSTMIGNFRTPGVRACDVRVSGHYAYLLAEDPYRLIVIDISDPSDPQEVRVIDYETWGHWLYLYNNYLLVGHRYLTIYDISNPENPIEIVNYTDVGNDDIQDICVSNYLIYAKRTHSMTIFRFEPLSIDNDELPREVAFVNYPNPFNAQTTINYSLPKAGPVSLVIYNIMGQKATTIFNGVQQAGEHKVVWDAKDVTSGVYFGRLEAGEKAQIARMLLLK